MTETQQIILGLEDCIKEYQSQLKDTKCKIQKRRIRDNIKRFRNDIRFYKRTSYDEYYY